MLPKKKIFRLIVPFMAVCLIFCTRQEVLGAEQARVLRSAGCKTGYFLIKDLADNFNTKGPLSVVPNRTGNKVGIKLLDAGKIDFAFTSKSQEALLEKIPVSKEHAGHWTSKIIASDPIVILVHRDNPIQSLSLSQIKDIFTGRVDNWQEVGGEALDITVSYLDTSASSGILAQFKGIALGKNNDGSPLLLRDDAIKASGPKKLGALVAQNRGAITFMGLTTYRERYGSLIHLNNIAPSHKNILNDSYPLIVNYYIIYDQRKHAEVSSFLKYMESTEGQNIIKQNFIIRLDR